MLPPALKTGGRPRSLQSYRRTEATFRASRITPAVSTLQTRAYWGRRRDEHHRHYNQKRLRNYNHEPESYFTEEAGKEAKERTSANHDPTPPPEPSRREQLWQQRMDHIRRAIDEDPYEALFGRSNRLLGRFGNRNWPLEIPNWWRKEVAAFKEPVWKRHMASWRIDIIGGSSSSPAVKESSAKSDMAASPAPTTTTTSRERAVSVMDNDEHLEYDPISNRMIRKSETGFSHYGQDLDAAVDIPVKQFNPAEKAQTSRERLNVSEKANEVLQSGNKPLQTSLDRYTMKQNEGRQPSFTMLKEEPYESQIPTPEPDITSVKVKENDSSNVRAEYDQYKAARLPISNFAKDDWLVQEGFLNPSSAMSASSTEASSLTTEKRFKLEKDFQEAHSVEKEMAENPLLDSKPWKVQRSKGTEVPAQADESSKGIFQSVRDEWSNEKLDEKQETNVLNTEVQKDVDDSTESLARKETTEPSTRHIKLAQESESGKAEEAAAMNEIMNYNMRVAKENMRNKEADAKKEMASNRARMAEIVDKARADVEVRNYQMQVAKDNMDNQVAGAQKETVDYRARIAEAIEEARAHAEILDLNFSRMGHRLRVSHIRKLQEAKEKVQDLIKKLEESREADYHAQSAQKQAADLKEIQGAGMALAKLAGEFEAKVGADASRVDQAYANVTGVGSDGGAAVPVNNDAAETPARFQLPRRIPSLAEFFGYTPKRDANTVMVQPREESKLEKARSSLEKEVDEQKAAMRALETPRVVAVAPPLHSQHESAWPVSQRNEVEEQQVDDSEALTREIRGIYETKYGKITTSHVQPSSESDQPSVIAKPIETSSSDLTPEVASASVATPKVIPAIAPAETPVSTKVLESPDVPASSPENTPIDTPAVPYTLLAYDSQTQSITRASFSSPPQASESIIPLTIALKHLHHPAKFLPLVQELRNKGYEPIHGEKNMLILRQMQSARLGEQEAFEVETVGAKDEPPTRLPSWGATSGPRRTEEVFSGASPSQSRSKKERKGRKRAWRRAVRRAALAVAAVGGTIYVAGVMAEMTKVVVG